MPTIIPDFSKIVIPDASGTPMYVYKVKDAEARAALSGGMKYIFAWKGTETPDVSKIPNTVTVIYNNTAYTGTLTPSAAHAAVPLGFWLVSNGDGGNNGYAEYAPVEDDTSTPSTWRWEKFGDLALSLNDFGALAYADIVELEKGNGVDVIGKDATLVAQPSAVTFASHSTDSVLGADTSFTVTGPTITDNSTTQSLSVVMGSVTVPDTNDKTAAVTGLNNQTAKTDVLTASSLAKKNYDTKTIRGVKATLGTTTGSTGKVTKKLGKKQIQEAESLDIVGSDLVTATTKKLVPKRISVPSGTDTVDGINVITRSKLATDTFRKVSVAPAGSPSTITGLSIRKYNEYYTDTENTIEGADNETLVISFSTTPTLLLADANNATTFATGSLVASSAQNYASITGGEIVSNITRSQKNVVTGIDTDIVASATLSTDPNDSGTDIITSVDTTGKVTAAKLKSGTTWVGTGGTVDMSQSGNIAGDNVITSVNDNVSVSVPELDTDVTVMTSTIVNSGGITLVSGANDSNYANVYTNIGFTTENVLKGTTSQTPTAQLKLDAGTPANSVSVITAGGVSVSGDYHVNVGTNDPVTAITGVGAATAAAQQVSFASKDLKKVALFDDLKIRTESHPATRYLNFVTPEGGTIALNKYGTPANISLEKSLDGVNWSPWAADNETGNRAVTLAAGERLYVRSTSITTARFSLSDQNYYKFSVPNGTEVNGIVESLICRTPELGEIGNMSNVSHHFTNLFRDCHIVGKPIINSKVVKRQSLEYAFRNTSPLNAIEIHVLTRNGETPFSGWLLDCASSGTIYAPAALTFSTNTPSGIPSGWSRSNI